MVDSWIDNKLVVMLSTHSLPLDSEEENVTMPRGLVDIV